MKFLADNCLNHNVVSLLRDRDHEVILMTDVIAPDSPDVSVAQLAIANEAILVTQDDDFRTQQKAAPASQREAFKKVNLLQICDLARETRRRVAKVIDLVEHDIEASLGLGERVHIQIQKDRIVIWR